MTPATIVAAAIAESLATGNTTHAAVDAHDIIRSVRVDEAYGMWTSATDADAKNEAWAILVAMGELL